MMSSQVVPQGYKQTKVGIIPLEWEVVKLDDVGKFIGGGTPFTKNEQYWQGSIPWISSSDLIDESIYIVNKHRFITESAVQESATKKVPKDSILIISRVGVGKVAINNEELCVSQDFQCLIPKKSNTIFLAYLIKERTKILLSYNQGTSIKGFIKSDLINFKIPLPPLKEQQKIAEILTTWDDAISKLDELITSKEQLKKGLMQKLLSGEVRFSGEWEDKKLKEVLKIGSGKDYKHLEKGIIPVYGTGGYMLSVNDYLYDGESVCIGRKGTIDKPMFLNGKFWTVDTLFYTHSYKNSIPKFLYFAFLQINWKKYNEASGVPSLSKTTIETIKIKLPPLQEQQKIAKVLSNADKEIDLLKNELQELKKQKKGLMQKLLTGEVRVKI